ncbi:chemotaxis protein CheW [Shewanella sp. OMA3-2]|uniref:chemotaxis protein CheW n=1 Tax=Shewanella sp. OMA3-2 TaxID=2908650 RepID=UPI001F3836AD|nr:chemotaxis protein CheW [Shewanella sp. OMA3-2]UJF21282.1 chemotaxis protein CheW [Shewanella sp. OMA3-2]
MSKSVDETVFDYFTLLLTEPTTESVEETQTAQSNIAKQEIVAPEALNPTTLISKDKISRTNSDKLTPALVTKKSIAEIKVIPDSSLVKGLIEPEKPSESSFTSKRVDKADVIKDHQIDDKYSKASFEPLNKPDTAVKYQQPLKSILERGFAEPNENINKQALEKLLSAVSKPEVKPEVMPTSSKISMTAEEIRASADKVRQHLGLLAEKSTKKTTVGPVSLQKTVNADKEIKPLVDINLTGTIPSSVNKAIIKSEEQLDVTPETQLGAVPPSITHDLQQVLDDEFQVLFFKVAGLTLAVPLVSLGGIVKVERINHLIGRPKWFLGVQPYREQKINVVDTCAWVMPEKYSPELAESIDYQYLVMLEDSRWGLACESLVNAVKIDKSHVNWRDKPGKRPWLAGVVKQQMCGILHVQALIDMLDAGLGCQDSIDRG